MEGLHELKKMLCEELEEYSRKGELSAGSLDVIHKLTDTIKNIDKIEMLEEYGEGDESYEGGDSYAGRRGGRSNRSDPYENANDGNSYRDGRSYKRDRYGRYSRDDGKEHMMKKMREMLGMAGDDRQREAIRQCMDQLERI